VIGMAAIKESSLSVMSVRKVCNFSASCSSTQRNCRLARAVSLLLRVTAYAKIAAMRRPDRYDFIGIAIVVFLIAIWVLHFVLPSPPPEPPGFQDGAGGPLASGPADRVL
jgi:hypothetical protein